MAEQDLTEKRLEEYNDVFADIVNVLLFNGKRFVQEDALAETSRLSQYKADDGLHEQERDIAKYWQDGNIRICLYGLENQTAVDADIALRVASYDGTGNNSDGVSFTLGDEVFGMFHHGDRVLVVDDVFDTGRTAEAVRARMDAMGVEMRLACVYFKPEKNETGLSPDYFVRDTGSEWIVFPHEIEGLSPDVVRMKSPLLAELLKDATAGG